MDLVQKFLDNPNLKKENSERLAKRFGVTIEQVTAIANMLGTLPANQCYNELTILLQAISKANEPKSE